MDLRLPFLSSSLLICFWNSYKLCSDISDYPNSELTAIELVKLEFDAGDDARFI